MKDRINKLSRFVSIKEGELSGIKSLISEKEGIQNLLIQRVEKLKASIEIVQKVAKKTQALMEYQVSNIVTKSLEAVFDNPYKFGLEFVVRRNKTECDPYFERNGHRLRPKRAGVGAVDIGAFGTRISMLNLSSYRRLLRLDEPFKHLRGTRNQQRTSSMLRNISRRRNIQMLYIADVRFTPFCDKEFRVVINQGVSTVEPS